MLSVQTGAGFAKRLMEDVGAAAVVMFRQGGAALVLLALFRPAMRGRTRQEWWTLLGFGAVLAAMNTSFYAAVERLPLGVAVTIELTGPLLLAVSLSRRLVDAAWVALAVAGVALLGGLDSGLDPVGVAFALVAAGAWAAYILMSRAAGRLSSGVGTLGLAMAVAAVLVAPAGLQPGRALVHPSTLAAAAVVAVLAGVVPFSLEMVALRTVPARVFGVLMSLSPVAAALSGFVLLDEQLGGREVVAMVMVMAASAATVATVARERRPTSAP
jgi:inner membrane transporter RhtA